MLALQQKSQYKPNLNNKLKVYKACQQLFLKILWNKFNLISYEILGTEPLDDLNGHIKNLYEEIVEHVPNKTYLQNVITLSYEGREVKRLLQVHCLLQVL